MNAKIIPFYPPIDEDYPCGYKDVKNKEYILPFGYRKFTNRKWEAWAKGPFSGQK